MSSLRRTAAVTTALLVLWSAAPAWAQRGMREGRVPRYDVATEATMRGTVQEVKAMGGRTGMGPGRGTGMGLGGVHVVLATGQESLEVHLGPAAYLTAQELSLMAGDQIEIIGSRVTVDGTSAVLARQVTVEGRTVTLRDEQGVPVWSRNRNR